MKMRPSDYEELKAEIEAVINFHKVEGLRKYKEKLKADVRIKDLDKRLRWDLLWAVPNTPRTVLMDRLYAYLDDTHIDTALKIISENEITREL